MPKKTKRNKKKGFHIPKYWNNCNEHPEPQSRRNNASHVDGPPSEFLHG